MLPVVNWSDPRLQPMAYVADRRRLFEVLCVDRTKGVTLVNCLTEERLTVGPREIVPAWRLVKEAPPMEVPEPARWVDAA